MQKIEKRKRKILPKNCCKILKLKIVQISSGPENLCSISLILFFANAFSQKQIEILSLKFNRVRQNQRNNDSLYRNNNPINRYKELYFMNET